MWKGFGTAQPATKRMPPEFDPVYYRTRAVDYRVSSRKRLIARKDLQTVAADTKSGKSSGNTDFLADRQSCFITSRSHVRILSPQLETPVSKFIDHGVIGKADAERRRPFRVLGPVVATSCDEGL